MTSLGRVAITCRIEREAGVDPSAESAGFSPGQVFLVVTNDAGVETARFESPPGFQALMLACDLGSAVLIATHPRRPGAGHWDPPSARHRLVLDGDRKGRVLIKGQGQTTHVPALDLVVALKDALCEAWDTFARHLPEDDAVRQDLRCVLDELGQRHAEL